MNRLTRILCVLAVAFLSCACEPPSIDCWGPNNMHLWGDQGEGHVTRGSEHVMLSDPNGAMKKAASNGGLVTVYDVKLGANRTVTLPPDVVAQITSAVTKLDCGRIRNWAGLESALWPESTSTSSSSSGGGVTIPLADTKAVELPPTGKTSMTLASGRYNDVMCTANGELILGNGIYLFHSLAFSKGSKLTVLPEARAVVYVEADLKLRDCNINATGQAPNLIFVPLNNAVYIESTEPSSVTTAKCAIYGPTVDVFVRVTSVPPAGCAVNFTGAVVGKTVNTAYATIAYDKRLKGLSIPGLGTYNILSLQELSPVNKP